MNFRIVIQMLGKISLVIAGLMVVPLIVSLIFQDGCFWGFLIPILLLVFLGLLSSRVEHPKSSYRSKEGYAIVFGAWILMSLVGALPFVITKSIPNYIDALFETVSGFTTTGSTILKSISTLPKSILFWRSFTHWIGGLGILMFMLAILPKTDRRSMYLMKAEVPGHKVEKLTTSTRKTALILYIIYFALTMILVVFLLFGGMSVFDAFVHAFGTAGTGGFSSQDTSIAYYDSAYIDVVITVFMGLFGVNYSLFYLLLFKRLIKSQIEDKKEPKYKLVIKRINMVFKHIKEVLNDEELRCYVSIILVSSVLVSLSCLFFHVYDNFFTSLRYGAFQVVSIITTTGFVTADYSQWPYFAQMILIAVMCIGACFGSTGGGIKVTRILIMVKEIKRDLTKLIEPRSVVVIRMNGKPVEKEEINATNLFFIAYMAVIAISCLLLSLDNQDLLTTITAVMTCINNVGPAFGHVGPTDNFSSFSAFGKLLLSFDMLCGRLDVLPLLLLLRAHVWAKS